MKLTLLAVLLVLFTAVGCKPSIPESPDPSAYGKVITPGHHVPKKHQDPQEKT